MSRLVLPLLAILLAFPSFGQNLIPFSELPSKTNRYENFELPVTVSNTGIVDAEKFFVHIALSADENFDPATDHTILHDYVWMVEAGGSAEVLLQTYFLDAPAGTYNLLVVADTYADVTETDETDNILVLPGFILEEAQIDLMFSSIDIPFTTAAIGDVFEVDFSITNVGSSSTGAGIRTAFFLSNDDTYDDGDVFIGSQTSYLTEGSAEATAEFVIPDAPPGNYYLIGKTDGPFRADRLGDDTFVELNEENNFISASITLSAPDIDLTGGTISQAYVYQESPYHPDYGVNASFTVKNAGTTPAGYFTYTCYLSDNLLLDEYDLEIGLPQKSYWQIGPGGTREFYLQASGIAPLSPGQKYLLVHLNSNNEIPETETGNNVLSYTVEVPPLVFHYVDFTSASIPYEVIAHDSQIIVNLEYTNNSPGDFQYTQWVNYTLVNSFGEGIAIESTYPEIFLPKGEVRNFDHEINLLEDLAEGTYTLTIQSSSNEISLQVVVKKGPVLSGTVTGEDEGVINAGKMYLYRKNSNGKYQYHNFYSLGGSSSFSFDLNRDDHVLYFIPDAALHPDYVPTIYDKVVFISEATVIQTSEDLEVNFSVLKVNPIDPGGRIINGKVTLPEDTGGRLRNDVADVSVILLDVNGKIVGLDYCDPDGNFEFRDLPAGKYSLVIGGIGERITLEPITVDISTYDAGLNIALGEENISIEKKFLQGLTLQPIIGKKYGDADFIPAIASMTEQSILIESSNPDVAKIENGKIKILKAGTTIISASQEGNDEFYDAVVEQEITVGKADQTIVFVDIEERVLGDNPFTLDAATNFQLLVTFTSSDEAVATIDGNIVEIVGVGETEITASQSGNENILAATPVTRILKVNAVTGMNEAPNLIVYPNPTPGVIYVTRAMHITRVDAIGVSGARHEVSCQEGVIDLRELSPGVYMLRISSREGTKRIRIVKE